MTRPVEDLAAVDAAFSALATTLASLTDAQMRAPSLLPGWTRGHVLTHLARNADGNRGMVEGAIRGEVVAQYPGGAEQRAADIEAGAPRPAVAQVTDVLDSQRALVDTWARLADDAWDRPTESFAFGIRPVRDGVRSRLRELLVHHVDLGFAYGPGDLPADWVAMEAEWLAEFRTPETWPHAAM